MGASIVLLLSCMGAALANYSTLATAPMTPAPHHHNLLQNLAVKTCIQDKTCYLGLLQAGAHVHHRSRLRTKATLDSTSDAAFFNISIQEMGEVSTCGTRAVIPQLQVELEVFRKAGILQSRYLECEVPSMSSFTNYLQVDLTQASRPVVVDRYMGPTFGFAADNKNGAAMVLMGAWGVCTLFTITLFISRACAAPVQGKKKQGGRSLSFWPSMAWLDSVICSREMAAGSPDHVDDLLSMASDLELEPQDVLSVQWLNEVKSHGLAQADLWLAIRKSVGNFTLAWAFLLTTLTSMLELVGMTIVLDILLNYLRWAADAHQHGLFLQKDLFLPSAMVIGLGFGVPLTARAFGTALNMCDAYHTNRIAGSLLSIVYEKTQRLPATGSGGPDHTHVINNDIMQACNGALKGCTQTLVMPFCALALISLLVFRLGWAAVFGTATVLWIYLLYFPLRDLVREQHMKWEKSADNRVGFMKEALLSIQSFKTSSSEGLVCDGVDALREEELTNKFWLSMGLSMLKTPLGLFPPALICSSLTFYCFMYGSIPAGDIFACMQILSALMSCLSMFSNSVQRTITLPNSVHRIEQILKQPERPTHQVQQVARHPGAPHVRVRGSFAFGEGDRPVLRDVDFSASRGEMVAIVGQTAAGKSALMEAMVGSLHASDPDSCVEAPKSVAYCSQTPWMLEASLSENITLGAPMDPQRFREALAAAAIPLNAVEESTLANSTAKQGLRNGNRAAWFPYFSLWNIMALTCLVLSIMNIKWDSTNMILGIAVVVIQGLLHWSVLEIPLQTIAALFITPQPPARAERGDISVILNYNLLAVTRDDVKECFENMFQAYIGNLDDKVSAVLVSATNDLYLQEHELQVRDEYRKKIYNELYHEGMCWAGLEAGFVDSKRQERIWSKFSTMRSNEFAEVFLPALCTKFSNEFMVVQRTSRVLRKCGQYQDLMLLSAGFEKAFTYCDASLYGKEARTPGQNLFIASEDAQRILGRNFDYTLVLDGDTRVKPGSVFELLEVAAAHPERAMIQPAIEMECGKSSTVFMYIESLRQRIHEPLNGTVTAILGESPFYGKGLIRNTAYISKCLGTHSQLIEAVPIDVLSHDTFEATILKPLYVDDVSLLEAPCHNYITWDIRERRWNRGEILLAMYFWPRLLGWPLGLIRQRLQPGYTQANVRTPVVLDRVSSYFAHAALRQMVLKPALVSYIVMVDFVDMHFEWTPIATVMFLIIVFPKIATCNRHNIKGVVLETIASVMQFTPESVVGTIRVLRALKAHVTGNARWVPQRAVEEEFKESNPFVFSLKYLWYYLLFALMSAIMVVNLMPEAIFITLMLGTLFLLPVYAGLTALVTDSFACWFPYFSLWNFFSLVCLVLSALNVDWSSTHPALAVLVVAIQGLLHWSVLEIPLKTIATFFSPKRPLARVQSHNLTLAMNYNLLAISTADVDECLANMYDAYMNNVNDNVSAVLVSATNDPCLQRYELQARDLYRERIYKKLYSEGMAWAGVEKGPVDARRRDALWCKFKHMDRHEFAEGHLSAVCEKFAHEFMVIHRVSRVLRKCGQYQDLMLLSQGESRAYTYCDKALYGKAARTQGEPLFYESEDVKNVRGRRFDYTLVLDSDTQVSAGTVADLLSIAAAYPERAIVQPAIKIACNSDKTWFMELESLRQSISEPMNTTVTSILGESSFYGKGLIKNALYIEKCLGCREALIEAVPVDVLSHDTFEAALLRPLYVPEVELLEAPCHNYVSWDIRERRWNRGELLLSMYFWPQLVGKPMKYLQRMLQGSRYNDTSVRTVTELGTVSSYFAHSAVRQMILKPLLVSYIVMVDFVEMHFEWLPILIVMFLIIVFPKIFICKKSNWRGLLLETMASIIQFTPESVVGTVRVLRAFKAHLTGNARWIPQRAIEEESKSSNSCVLAFRYLWQYPIFAVVCGVVVWNIVPDAIFIMWLLGTLIALPVFAGLTGLEVNAKTGAFPYFWLWNIAAVVVFAFNILNMDWGQTRLSTGIAVILIQGLLHWSVLEIPLTAIATLVTPKPKLARGDGSKLTLALNYNLLAVSHDDVDECLRNMHEAFMDNLDNNVSAILVSATNDLTIKKYELQVRDQYREMIYNALYTEGMSWAGLGTGPVDKGRNARIWSKFTDLGKHEFVKNELHSVCEQFAREFMVVHRTSRVLRKCGQYQDLMLLSSGEDKAFTYCDTKLYGTAARPEGEVLFQTSPDEKNVKGRRFDYTLVLDSDTRVEAGSVFQLLDIAAAYPNRAIIQPGIKMDCSRDGSIFMQLEALRQNLHEPVNSTITTILGQSSFYGKGLIKNSIYIEKCIGTRENLVEAVPVDVLSHDTFEAAVLRPMYAHEVQLLEAPCNNYITWDIRERRWNRGELLLAMYFWPTLIGIPMRAVQRLLQGKAFNPTQARRNVELDKNTAYFAHAALRQMVLKPLLVTYIILVDFVEMHMKVLPIATVMFLIIVFPKISICNASNIKGVIVETIASILQFTPEAVVGTIRVMRSLKAHLTGNARWVPQSAIEKEFKASNPFLFSMSYLWYYPMFAFICGCMVLTQAPEAIFVLFMLGTLCALPIFAGITGLPCSWRFPYFFVWNCVSLGCLILSILNVDWSTTHLSLGVAVVAIQGALHWSVLEIPLQTVASIFTRRPQVPRADSSNLSVVLNYNLLAMSRSDVDDCMRNMYEAFMGNLCDRISAVLVSATSDLSLQRYETSVRDYYRTLIHGRLLQEGRRWAGFDAGPVDARRYDLVWSAFEHIDRHEFVQKHLDSVCRRFASEFMVLHRTSKVLRKCGQYQDLMLLASGIDQAFTYCDVSLYGTAARRAGEPLFLPSQDVDRVKSRHFDYTLVLDGDTRVIPGTVADLLSIAAAHPDRAIIQPAIQMSVEAEDTYFMHLEALRQHIHEPLSSTLTTIFGESSFYGKGLIRNEAYIQRCIGTENNLIEAVPIDVLSHDTFEAAVLRPMYTQEVCLLEGPCHNYVSWDIRERRWNRGEILLATYFWPRLIGTPFHFMQRMFQGSDYNQVKLRTHVKLDPVPAYIAHSALRQMVLKPLLVTYIILMDFVDMHYEWLPIITVMFLIIVFPKIVLVTKDNFKGVVLETVASVLQFTPESVVGTIRVLRAVKAHVTGNARWLPQRAVEDEFRVSNPFTFSLRHLWYYMAFSLVAGLLVVSMIPEAVFIMTMLGTLFMLPVYAGITGFVAGFSWMVAKEESPRLCNREITATPMQAARTKVFDLTDTQEFSLCNHDEPLPEETKGKMRSGCQSIADQTRVAMARAAYSWDAELVLVDNPFAFIDAATSAHILDELEHSPLFKNRTRVVVMPPRRDQLKHFDRVVVFAEGNIVSEGKPEEVFQHPAFHRLNPPKEDGKEVAEALLAARSLGVPQEYTEAMELKPIRLDVEEADAPQNLPPGGPLWGILASSGTGHIVTALIVTALLRIALQGQMLVMGYWADLQDNGVHTNGKPYIYLVMGAAVAAGILESFLNYLVISFNRNLSKELFSRALSCILRAPAEGAAGGGLVERSIGRLSSDMLNVDLAFSTSLTFLSSFIFSVIVLQIYCFRVMPWWLVLPTNIIITVFLSLSWSTSVPLQYLAANTLAKCQEEQAVTLQTNACSQAFQCGSKLLGDYRSKVNLVIRPEFVGVACTKQWVLLRVTFSLCAQCTACILYGMLQPGSIHLGSLAIVVASTFHVIQGLDGFMDALFNSTLVAISMKRIDEYLCLQTKDGVVQVPGKSRRDAWIGRLQAPDLTIMHAPSVGDAQLQIENLCVKRNCGAKALYIEKLTLNAGAKAVLVGPQGSGRSTLLQSIVKAVDADKGRILIGGVDTQGMSLHTLRAMVCYLPQMPFILAGSVRSNLDPLGVIPDSQIWDALRCVKLLSAVRDLPHGLDHELPRGGGSLSLGQKQLLCLARAICQRPKILLMDECLSATDPSTSKQVLDTVSGRMVSTTILLASSRAEEVLQSDHILVMQHGTIEDEGSADELMSKEQGTFMRFVSGSASH